VQQNNNWIDMPSGHDDRIQSNLQFQPLMSVSLTKHTYSFEHGWTIGTQPTLSVDWKAPGDEGVVFSIGPQVGRIRKCGGTPPLFQLQVQYSPVRPSVGSPTWGIQLQVTPTIPALIKKTLF